MLAEITRQCPWCSSHITIQNKSEVIDKTVDGRRHLTTICIVCDSEIPISIKRINTEEVWKKKQVQQMKEFFKYSNCCKKNPLTLEELRFLLHKHKHDQLRGYWKNKFEEGKLIKLVDDI